MTIVQTSLLGDDREIQDDRAIALKALEATKGIGTCRVTSVSGGRSSAYMAVHYPADYYVFACVRTNDPKCRVKDKGLLREIRKRCPEFEGSKELDLTLKNVIELEQLLGKPIQWVWGPNFEDVIESHKGLPHKAARFCTQEMKTKPIFDWAILNVCSGDFSEAVGHFIPSPIEMDMGFRVDEPNRVFKMLGAKWEKGVGWDWGKGTCEDFKVNLFCDIQGKHKGQHRHKKLEWRFRQAPMFVDGITRFHVNQFWEKMGWEFPEVSNCDFCFFHKPEEHEFSMQSTLKGLIGGWDRNAR